VRVDNVRSDNEIDIQVVTTAEQFMHAIAVRAICFMEETGLSVSQTIDGNDYQATHFVIYAKRELSARRDFDGFAILPKSSEPGSARPIATSAFSSGPATSSSVTSR
jgi:hypothetical protein